MQDTYYVQTQARRMLNRLHRRNYENTVICPQYLDGIDKSQFWDAFGELHNILELFFTQAIETPAALSLPLFTADKVGSSEIIKGLHPLLDLPITLFAMGVASIRENNVLIINVDEFKHVSKNLRYKNFSKAMNWLVGNGFTITEWNGKGFNNTNDTFVLDYPDNPSLLVVLSVIGRKLRLHMQTKIFMKKTRRAHNAWGLSQFVFLDPNIYADDSGELPPVSLEHLLDIAGESHRDIICTIADKFTQRGFMIQSTITPHDSIVCEICDKKGKSTLNHIRFDEDNIALRLKLNHPDKYIGIVENLPSHLKDRFEKIWCQNCAETCSRKIKYTLHGTNKIACGCEVFVFRNPTINDLDLFMELFDAEQSARAKK